MAASDQALTYSGLYHWLRRVALVVVPVALIGGLLVYSYSGRAERLVPELVSLPCDDCTQDTPFYSPSDMMPKMATVSSTHQQNLIVTKLNSTHQQAVINPTAMAGRVRRFPQAIIIGARKGGTRALIDMLGSHPDIVTAVGEVHYFDSDVNYSKGLQWYINKMPLSTPEQITLEKSPSYFVKKDTPLRVYEASREVKLILIVRDPIERAISDFAQLDAKKLSRQKTRRSFDEAVFESNGDVKTSKSPILVSLYDIHMDRWLTYFKLEQILVVNGDRLIHDPVPELQEAEKFLGVRPYFQKDMFVYNKEKGFFCWKRVIAKSREVPYCLGSGKGRDHPVISETTKAKLRNFFSPHNQRFYSLVHQDFGW